VSELGDLLELLHGARNRCTTVRATVRTWAHSARQGAAFARLEATSYAPLEGSRPETSESQARIWLAGSDHAREEHDGARVGVQRGAFWWRYDGVDDALSNEGDPTHRADIGEPLRSLADASPVMGLFDFDRPDPGEHAGRRTVRVRAVPRDLPDYGTWALTRLGAAGADDLLVDVDAERGVLLRVEARLGGEPFSIIEVLEIAFDESFPDDTFVFTPPPGVEVRSVLKLRDLSLEEAVAAAPFAFWLPAEDWEPTVAYAQTDDEPHVAPQVHLQYLRNGVRIAQSPAGHPDAMSGFVFDGAGPWRELERGGRTMEVQDHVERRPGAQVRLVLEGTRVVVHSWSLDADALADVAAGLKRAP
jgi:hypothetical protein